MLEAHAPLLFLLFPRAGRQRRAGAWVRIAMRSEDLTAADRLVWDAFSRGELVDLRAGDPAHDDLAVGVGWGADRTIRAM